MLSHIPIPAAHRRRSLLPETTFEVPGKGLEPSRPHGHVGLSHARLPFRQPGRSGADAPEEKRGRSPSPHQAQEQGRAPRVHLTRHPVPGAESNRWHRVYRPACRRGPCTPCGCRSRYSAVKERYVMRRYINGVCVPGIGPALCPWQDSNLHCQHPRCCASTNWATRAKR